MLLKLTARCENIDCDHLKLYSNYKFYGADAGLL